MSKGIFGNMFDFNGNGDLDIFEQAAEFAFLQKMMEDDDKADSADDDDDGLSITLDFKIGTDDDAAGEDWRDQYYGNEMNIDPDDYDSEEEYQEAVSDKEAWISAIPDNISALAQEYFIEPEDYDSYEDFIEAVKDVLG